MNSFDFKPPKAFRLSATGLALTRDLDEVADMVEAFKDPRARAAFRHVVSAVVDWRGQVVTMADRAYLTEAMPCASSGVATT